MKLPIYLDYNATTPVDPRVVEAMKPFFSDAFGNAASIDHQHGAHVAVAVEAARATIAKSIGARSEEIVFTSGATEADNLALVGVMEANEDRGDHLITTRAEHPAILETAAYLQRRGKRITLLEVDRSGLVDPEDIKKAITDRTVLVSLMAVNNEVGTLAPIAEIGRVTRERGVLFHTDATQAVGKLEIDVQAMKIDLMSFSSHKVYGPKGVGALYVRRRQPFVRIAPLIHGGGHERGIRSGTANSPGIVGFAKALELCNVERKTEQGRLAKFAESFLNTVISGTGDVELNGHPNKRIPQCLNLFIPGVENKALIVALKNELSISAGSACATSKVEPSHVLLALGHPESRSYNSIRISMGRFTLEAEAAFAAQQLVAAVKGLRSHFTRA
jgi:cysteine desulfurase